MKALLNNIIFMSLTLSAVTAHAQSSTELSCRAQAKEVAAQTYSTCLSEARSAQIDQIRKDYQQQLADLKSKYDQELKKIANKESGDKTPLREAKKESKVKAKKTAKKGSAPRATKGVAKTLPTRSEVTSTETVIQDIQATPVVTTITPDAPPQNDTDGDLSIELLPATDLPEMTAAPGDDIQAY